MSKGEEKICALLHKAKMDFEREKHFVDLKQGLFRFDFYVMDVHGAPAIIEYNGAQHYYPNSKFYHSRAEFLKQQNNDRRKISYCLSNNIPIYCIPFWELDHLTSAADCFQPQFLATTRWKNDDDWRIHNAKM